MVLLVWPLHLQSEAGGMDRTGWFHSHVLGPGRTASWAAGMAEALTFSMRVSGPLPLQRAPPSGLSHGIQHHSRPS